MKYTSAPLWICRLFNDAHDIWCQTRTTAALRGRGVNDQNAYIVYSLLYKKPTMGINYTTLRYH